MSRKVRIYRYDPSRDAAGSYDEFEVNETPGMSVMDVLDYIYSTLDPSLSYYSHSRCEHGVCARCAVRVNGKNGLACETSLPAKGEITIEPTSAHKVVKDLIVEKS